MINFQFPICTHLSQIMCFCLAIRYFMYDMFFSSSYFVSQNVKKSNPGIAFTDVGKVLGDRWNKMSGTAILGKP